MKQTRADELNSGPFHAVNRAGQQRKKDYEFKKRATFEMKLHS